jgi:hypothetical protein
MKLNYLKDFIAVYDDVLSSDDCQKIIQHYEKVRENNLTFNRQQHSNASLKINKDTENYFLSNTSIFANDNVDEIISTNDKWIFEKFKESLTKCYFHYTAEYSILDSLSKHSISGTVKIQKTKPSQGYHVWHCEHGSITYGNRLLLAILYLNNIEEGGETEFLYQSLRVKPKQGTLLFCPSGFTHTHRGNPPLSGDKYIMNTWIEFTE